MNFEYSDKVKNLLERVTTFMEQHVLPVEEKCMSNWQKIPGQRPR